ncbi:MAG: response regulator [Candidatus Saganbacteria bacterium]|nr:response regulator [Candidatus Saganbacteria bacterium]
MKAIKLLFVDDEVALVQMIKINLEAIKKYKVKTESNSQNALSAAKRFKPDFIFLDIMMPVLDGYGVLKLLKEDRETRSIPVIMLSAVTTDDAKIRSAGLFDEYYLEKPVSTETIEAVIEKIMSRKSGSANKP